MSPVQNATSAQYDGRQTDRLRVGIVGCGGIGNSAN